MRVFRAAATTARLGLEVGEMLENRSAAAAMQAEKKRGKNK